MRIINKYIISFLIFYAIWLGGIPYLFNRILPVICDNLSYNSNYTVTVSNPNLRLNIIPVISFQADNLSIESKSDKNNLAIEQPNMKIRLLPLISGKLHINNISAKNLDVNFTTRETFSLDKNFINNIKKSGIYCDSVKIDNFNINIIQKNKNIPIKYYGKNILFKKNNHYIKINSESKLLVNNKESEIFVNMHLPRNNNYKHSNLTVHISDFDIGMLGIYFKNYLPKKISKINGIINVDADKNNLTSVMQGINIDFKDKVESIKFPDKLVFDSDFNISGKSINIENADIKSERMHIFLTGTITDYINPKLASINMNAGADKTNVQDLINMLPAINTEDIDIYSLKKYGFNGDLIGNIKLRGSLLEPMINGNAYIKNGILIEPIKGAPGATIKLKFTGKYINFDAVVPANSGEKVYVKGSEELYNIKYSDMRIWSSKNVDLRLAASKVLPLHEIFNFVLGPLPIMDIEGKGNIDITVKGNRKNPHIWGDFNIINAKTYFCEMPNIFLSEADAKLAFDDENVSFDLYKGFINGEKISIKGLANLFGKFDFDVEAEKQDLAKIQKTIQNSLMLEDLNKVLPEIELQSGLANLKLKVYGEIPDINKLKFNQNFFIKGSIDLFNTTALHKSLKLINTKGKITFDGLNANADITTQIGKAPAKISVIIKNSVADAKICINNLNLPDIFPDVNDTDKDYLNLNISADMKYKGKIDIPDFDKIDLHISSIKSDKTNKVQINEGEIFLKNNRLSIRNIRGKFIDTMSELYINTDIDNIFTKPNVNGSVRLSNFDVSLINVLSKVSIVPKTARNTLSSIRFDKGKINLSASISNNKLKSSTNLGGISLTYIPQDLPLTIANGSIYAKNDFIGINKINLIADDMPILLDGNINNVFTKPEFNIYVNSKPKQDFINKYVNNNRVYPIKIKGDIVYSLRIKGTQNDYNITAQTDLAKSSSLYYLGAFVGDNENDIVLVLNMQVLKQKFLKIKEFSYDKLIASQGTRKTRRNMLKAQGQIDLYDDDLIFHDLTIKTTNPTDARIFNVLFRKPNIKQGQFTSDLRFNGRLSNPKLLGSFHIFETNIPFLDTTMKNVSFKFKDKTIDIYSTGEILGNDVRLKSTMRNKLTTPYYIENAEIYTKLLDLNYITEKLKSSQVDNYGTFESFENFDISTLIIKNLKMNADKINLRNISAEKVIAFAELNEAKQLKVRDFRFNLAKGLLHGKFEYNLKNSRTLIDLEASQISANELSYAIFDLNNQIYGDLTGKLNLSCSGTNFNHCMETLNGNVVFNVSDGKMPKLGSLEYLLRAGNLIKGGITGLSINSIIDIITPLKTGNFSNIYGIINISNGIANNIEIATKGKTLSLFLTGNYNFSTSVAEMEVLGILSKKISTVFGGVGNLSLNTLFNIIPGVDLTKDSNILEKINKIPALELSEKAYRKFIAEIKGNINGDNYVSSFKWIN